jgi:hypothetical protein
VELAYRSQSPGTHWPESYASFASRPVIEFTIGDALACTKNHQRRMRTASRVSSSLRARVCGWIPYWARLPAFVAGAKRFA